MKSPIGKKYNPDIAARFGDIETYHETRGKSAKARKKTKLGNQGHSQSMPSKNASYITNSYKQSC